MKVTRKILNEGSITVNLNELPNKVEPFVHKVIPSEVDSFQVVHYSRYYEWLSGALIKFFKSQELGAGHFDDGTVQIRIAKVKGAYSSSARMGDTVTATVKKVLLKEKNLEMYFRVECEGIMLMRAVLTVAFVSSDSGRLTFVADDVMKTLTHKEASNV